MVRHERRNIMDSGFNCIASQEAWSPPSLGLMEPWHVEAPTMAHVQMASIDDSGRCDQHGNRPAARRAFVTSFTSASEVSTPLSWFWPRFFAHHGVPLRRTCGLFVGRFLVGLEEGVLPIVGSSVVEGGTNDASTGSGQWIDSLAPCHARIHLQPPLRQGHGCAVSTALHPIGRSIDRSTGGRSNHEGAMHATLLSFLKWVVLSLTCLVRCGPPFSRSKKPLSLPFARPRDRHGCDAL